MATPSPPLPTISPTRKSSQELPEPPVISQQSEPRSEQTQPERTDTDDMAVDNNQLATRPLDLRSQVKTPELQMQQAQNDSQSNGHRADTQPSPSTPGHLPPFKWDEFQTRYEQALSEANEQEKELLEEFDRLVKYFNVWASAASAHDNERAVKRLQTRERFVRIAEQSLDQKKQHLTEVVRAFQSALALLSRAD